MTHVYLFFRGGGQKQCDWHLLFQGGNNTMNAYFSRGAEITQLIFAFPGGGGQCNYYFLLRNKNSAINDFLTALRAA